MPRFHPSLDWPRSQPDVPSVATGQVSWFQRHKVLTSLGLLALLILLISTRLNVPDGPETAVVAAPEPQPSVLAADPSVAHWPQPRPPDRAAVRAHAQARADAAARAAAEADLDDTAMPQVGDLVRDEQLEFTVTKIECGLRQIGGNWLNATPQGQFCLMKVQVENVGNRPQAFYGDHQVLVTTKGQRYAPSADAASYLENSRSLYERLDPGDQLTGRVVYDIPKRSTPDRIDLHASLYSPGVAVVLS